MILLNTSVKINNMIKKVDKESQFGHKKGIQARIDFNYKL